MQNTNNGKMIVIPAETVSRLEGAVRTLLDVIVEMQGYSEAVPNENPKKIQTATNIDQSLAEEFSSSAVEVVYELKAALEAKDWQSAKCAAHRLVGDAALCGFEQISDIARSIETSAKEQVPATTEMLNSLQAELNVLGVEPAIEKDFDVVSESVELFPDIIKSIYHETEGYDELITEFVGGLESKLSDLDQAAAGSSWDSVAALANQLAGDASLHGFPQCNQALKELEQRALAGSASSVRQALESLGKLQHAMRRGL